MRTKSVIKIVILSFFTIVIVICGIVMYQRLNHDKQVFHADIRAYIPAGSSAVLQINKNKSANILLPYFGNLKNILSHLEDSFLYPFYVLEQGDNLSFLAKLTKEQELTIKQKIRNELFSSFPPKKRFYKDAELLFYTSSNSQFFVCMFYKGIFAGGYNYKVLEQIVDADNTDNFFSNELMLDLAEKVKDSYVANLYTSSKDIKAAYNISFENKVQYVGYIIGTDSRLAPLEQSTGDSLKLDYSIFPSHLKAFSVQKNAPALVDTLRCFFEGLSYQFYVTEKSSPIWTMRFNVDKFLLFDILNDMERKHQHKNLIRSDYSKAGKYYIYNGSVDFSKEVFNQNSVVYFAFKNQYLICSPDKDELIKYLTDKGNYVNELNIAIHPESTSLFYTENITKIAPDYFHPDSKMVNHSDTVAVIQSHRENNYLKINFERNNSIKTSIK